MINKIVYALFPQDRLQNIIILLSVIRSICLPGFDYGELRLIILAQQLGILILEEGVVEIELLSLIS